MTAGHADELGKAKWLNVAGKQLNRFKNTTEEK
jgi:hypothetical protein